MKPDYIYDGAYLLQVDNVAIPPSNFLEFPWIRGYFGHYIQLVPGFSQPAWSKPNSYKHLDLTFNFRVDFRLYGENVASPKPLQRRSVYSLPADVMFLQECAFLDYGGNPPPSLSVVRVTAPVGAVVRAFNGPGKIVWS